MTKKPALLDIKPDPTDHREFAAGTTVESFDHIEAQKVKAANDKQLNVLKTTLDDGTVVETVHGVDHSMRLSQDFRDPFGDL